MKRIRRAMKQRWRPFKGVRRPVRGIWRQCKKYEDELNDMDPSEGSAENMEAMQEV
jgi:hypothetical protein